MSVTHQFNVEELHVFPSKNGLTNVVGLVLWSVVFTDTATGAISTGMGETLLGDPNPAAFVPVENVTEATAIDWVIAAQGGQTFVDQLQAIHAGQLAYNVQKIGLVPWSPTV
jgi:hypothetical protein